MPGRITKEGYEWRSIKTGKHFIVNKKTGKIVGGHTEKSRKPVKSDSGKHFTQKELDANMELAVNTLIEVKCKKGLSTPSVIVKRVSDHANFRMLDRGITVFSAKRVLEHPNLIMKGNRANSIVYQSVDIRIFVLYNETLETCIRKENRRYSSW